MITREELHPDLLAMLDGMTEGLEPMEAARLQYLAIQRFEQVASLGVILPSTASSICVEILEEDCRRIEGLLQGVDDV
jgi:hypothetical protein